MRIEDILSLAPVLPVVTIDDAAKAAPLARALVAGGLRAMEITLRTPAALEAVRIIAREVPDALPGVGTVLTAAGPSRRRRRWARASPSSPRRDAGAGWRRRAAAVVALPAGDRDRQRVDGGAGGGISGVQVLPGLGVGWAWRP